MKKDAINYGLEQDAQAFAERNPMKGKDPKVMCEIAEMLREFLSARDMTQAKFARSIGINPGAVSKFLRDDYRGDSEKIANKALNYIKSVQRRESRMQGQEFVKTTVAVKIGTLIDQTDGFSIDEGKIGVIIGDGGHGKSKCMRHYSDINQNAIYVELDRSMGVKLMLEEIASKLKLDTAGSMGTISKRIAEYLYTRKVILLLDEASSLQVKHLDMLRQVICVKGKSPMILAGNYDLLNTIMQPKTRHGYESLDQFTSRLVAIVNLDELAGDRTGGGGGIYTESDFRKLYEYNGVKLNSSAVTTLRNICKAPRSGRFRTCSLIISALHTSKAVTSEGKIGREHIVAAIEQLNLPVKVFLPVHTSPPGSDNAMEQESASAAG